jgi:predicted aspartyl protease
MRASLALLMLVWSSSALTAPIPRTAAAVLAANRAAVGPMPAKGTLELDYTLDASGLTGPATHVHDLTTGAFVDRFDASVISGGNGYDGRIPWQTDVSGVSIDQEGGDRITVAVNEAYRNANLWWRADRGGAMVVYVGHETVDGRPADHLAVTPRGGHRFEAWFDSQSHMLVRTGEPQQFFKTQTLYGDYGRVFGVMIAHRRTVDFGTGDPQKLDLKRANFGPARPLTAYATPRTALTGGRIEGDLKSVTLPFRLLNNHVYVEASVNGKGPYTFIVDTGGHTLISPRVAADAGLKVEGAGKTSGAGEGTGTTGFARYREIALGPVRLTDQPAFITDIYDRNIEGIPIDGMVGFELFARFVVQLDYGAKTMTISDFESFDPRGAGTAVPFKFYDHLPAVRGLIDGLPARFDIDTGSRSEVDITTPFVARHRLRERYRPGISTITGWGVGGAARSYVVRIPSLTLGSVKVPNIVSGLSESKAGSTSDPNYEGNIGSGLLKRFVATFDYSRQTMYLKPLEPQPADAGSFDRSGLWINAADHGFEVEYVAPGGPAEQAGMLKGDVITVINGKPARAEELSDARTLLRSLPAGSTVELSLLRAGKPQVARVRLRDLI